jgi:Cu+-exporting ATPase
MVGTGRGAKKGILIRDIDALQNAQRIDTVVLDKTGTITRGKPVVTKVMSTDLAEDEILRLAAAAEQFSEHPLARAVVACAVDRGVESPQPESFNNEPGLGVSARVEGRNILVGNIALLKKHRGISNDGEPQQPNLPGTLVHVAEQRDGEVHILGMISIADELKPDSARAISELHQIGLRTILLTGDNRTAAQAIASQVGIDDVRAEVKPDGKAAVIAELQDRKSQISNVKSAVAMVGDGINDAPALAQADLGIAIGTGSDIAKQTSDIVLVGGSLHGIAVALRLGRATMRTIHQNLFFAFIYNVLAIPLAAFGLLNPYIAAAAMALSDVTVIGNALLLRRSNID